MVSCEGDALLPCALCVTVAGHSLLFTVAVHSPLFHSPTRTENTNCYLAIIYNKRDVNNVNNVNKGPVIYKRVPGGRVIFSDRGP